MKTEHTPTPWVTDERYDGMIYCDDATGSKVAAAAGQGFEFVARSTQEQIANAALIVRAVNNFQRLLDALRDAEIRLKGAGMLGGETDPVCSALLQAEAR